MYHVNKEFLSKMNKAYSVVKFVMRTDLHKKGVLFHVLQVLKHNIKLVYCEHNDMISDTIFKYFKKIYIFHIIRQINNVVKGKNLKPIPPNASNYFKNAREIYNKHFNYKKLNKR